MPSAQMKVFNPASKGKIDIKVFALPRLTFCENLLIGQDKGLLSVLTGVRIKQVEFRGNVRAFPRD